MEVSKERARVNVNLLAHQKEAGSPLKLAQPIKAVRIILAIVMPI
tara:strand:+ start:773 stop:907 length:135 start_codon:yes stop_codon:yes gene_type:complete